MAAAELPLGEWLAAHKAAEYEQALRAEGCESVSDLVESGLTEDHLRELGFKLALPEPERCGSTGAGGVGFAATGNTAHQRVNRAAIVLKFKVGTRLLAMEQHQQFHHRWRRRADLHRADLHRADLRRYQRDLRRPPRKRENKETKDAQRRKRQLKNGS